MLAFFLSPIGRDIGIFAIIVALIGGCYFYYETSQAEISTLKSNLQVVEQQAKDLTVAKNALEKQVADVKKAQDVANSSINQAATAAAKANRDILAAQTQLKALGKTNPRALEQQINTDTAKTFKELEDASK